MGRVTANGMTEIREGTTWTSILLLLLSDGLIVVVVAVVGDVIVATISFRLVMLEGFECDRVVLTEGNELDEASFVAFLSVPVCMAARRYVRYSMSGCGLWR